MTLVGIPKRLQCACMQYLQAGAVRGRHRSRCDQIGSGQKQILTGKYNWQGCTLNGVANGHPAMPALGKALSEQSESASR